MPSRFTSLLILHLNIVHYKGWQKSIPLWCSDIQSTLMLLLRFEIPLTIHLFIHLLVYHYCVCVWGGVYASVSVCV